MHSGWRSRPGHGKVPGSVQVTFKPWPGPRSESRSAGPCPGSKPGPVPAVVRHSDSGCGVPVFRLGIRARPGPSTAEHEFRVRRASALSPGLTLGSSKFKSSPPSCDKSGRAPAKINGPGPRQRRRVPRPVPAPVLTRDRSTTMGRDLSPSLRDAGRRTQPGYSESGYSVLWYCYAPPAYPSLSTVTAAPAARTGFKPRPGSESLRLFIDSESAPPGRPAGGCLPGSECRQRCAGIMSPPESESRPMMMMILVPQAAG
jgi:hypothetical protein